MKKQTITLISLLFLSTFYLPAVDFAPVGATWYYEQGFFSEVPLPQEDYNRLESVKDTMYHGKLCRKIEKKDWLQCSDRPTVEYIYTSNDSVFFYDPIVNDFQLLYDFNAEKGDSWYILMRGEKEAIFDTLTIVVDSVDKFVVNEIELRRMFVTYRAFHFENGTSIEYKTYSSEIIENIGDTQYLFNYIPWWAEVCDANFMLGLCSYIDVELGLYKTGSSNFCNKVTNWMYGNVYDLKTESADPNAIDTTYFWYENDSLYIRNINNEFCCSSHLFAETQWTTHSLQVEVSAAGPRCLAACSFGYTVGIKSEPFDSLNVTINGDAFEVVYQDIVNSVEDITKSQNLLFPNPVKDMLTIKVPTIQKVRVFSISGALVLTQNEPDNIINLSDLKSGPYIVSIQSQGQYYTQKIVKQ